MINIVISPSQQAWNKCAFGDSEQDHAYDICKKLVEYLRAYNCNVNLIPKMDNVSESLGLKQIVEMSNHFIEAFGGIGYHLDVHTDAGYAGKGASAFYVSESGKGFITQIWRGISALTPWGDGNIRERNNLYILNNTIATSGLIELSFHDNVEQAKWLHQYIDAIAKNLCESIVAATGMQKLDIPVEHWAESSYKKLVAAGYKINERRFDEPLRRGEYFVVEAQKL